MSDLVWSLLLFAGITLVGLLLGGSRAREDARSRRRWDAAFDHESRRMTHTDATGMLVCRSCGAGAPERAGRCPSCRAIL